MAKKDREKKRQLRAENATEQSIARKEEKARIKQEVEEKKAKGKGLMSAGMASLVVASLALIFADIFNPSFGGSLKMFAYGLTVAAGGSLMASSRYAAKNSRKWLLFSGLAAVILGMVSFFGQAAGILV